MPIDRGIWISSIVGMFSSTVTAAMQPWVRADDAVALGPVGDLARNPLERG